MLSAHSCFSILSMRVGGILHFLRHNVIIVGVIVVAAGCDCFFILHRPHKQPTSQSFAALTANVVQFDPFQFEVLNGFSVNSSKIAYSQGILIFQLQNNQGQSIAVTEQLLPESVADNTDPSATQVQGADGSALVTYNGTETTGALFSNTARGRKTMVLLNTTDPISQSTVEDLLRGLRPTSLS